MSKVDLRHERWKAVHSCSEWFWIKLEYNDISSSKHSNIIQSSDTLLNNVRYIIIKWKFKITSLITFRSDSLVIDI